MHRQNRPEPQQDLSCLSIAGGYVYSSKQKGPVLVFQCQGQDFCLRSWTLFPASLQNRAALFLLCPRSVPGQCSSHQQGLAQATTGGAQATNGEHQERAPRALLGTRSSWAEAASDSQVTYHCWRGKIVPKQNDLTSGPCVTCIRLWSPGKSGNNPVVWLRISLWFVSCIPEHVAALP